MERKSTMIGLFGTNVFFYVVDLFILYYRYLANPWKYVGVFNFEILYSFMLSLFLMIPTVMSYFVLFNYFRQQEATHLVGEMLMITMINLVFVVIAMFYAR